MVQKSHCEKATTTHNDNNNTTINQPNQRKRLRNNMFPHPLNPYAKNKKTLPPPSALKIPAKRVVLNPYEKKNKKQQQHHQPALPLVSPSPRAFATTVDDRSSNDSVLFLTNSSPRTTQPSNRPPLSPLRTSVRKVEREDQGKKKRQRLMNPGTLIDTNIRRCPLDDSNGNKENNRLSTGNGEGFSSSKEDFDNRFFDDALSPLNSLSTSVSISVFLVHGGGLYCRLCNKAVGSALETIRRHLKKHHPTSLHSIPKFTKFYSEITAAQVRMSSATAAIPVATDSPIVTRLKCSSCQKSYSSKFNFNKHVRGSSGRCDGSLGLMVRYTKSPFGNFVQCVQSNTATRTSPLSSNFLTSIIEAPRPFEKIGNVLAAYVCNNEDVDTFASLFGPLMQTGETFQSVLLGYIQRYAVPPGPTNSNDPLF